MKPKPKSIFTTYCKETRHVKSEVYDWKRVVKKRKCKALFPKKRRKQRIVKPLLLTKNATTLPKQSKAEIKPFVNNPKPF